MVPLFAYRDVLLAVFQNWIFRVLKLWWKFENQQSRAKICTACHFKSKFFHFQILSFQPWMSIKTIYLYVVIYVWKVGLKYNIWLETTKDQLFTIRLKVPLFVTQSELKVIKAISCNKNKIFSQDLTKQIKI